MAPPATRRKRRPGADYVRDALGEIPPFAGRVADIVAIALDGLDRVVGLERQPGWLLPWGVELLIQRRELSTGGALTPLVMLSHQHGVRLEIMPWLGAYGLRSGASWEEYRHVLVLRFSPAEDQNSLAGAFNRWFKEGLRVGDRK